MRLIAILAVSIVCAIYTGYFNMDLAVWGVPLPVLATATATAGLAYVLALFDALNS